MPASERPLPEAMRQEHRPEIAGVPIGAVTAHCGDHEWRDHALEAGCVACVGKPVGFEKLERLIGRVLTNP